MSMWSTVKGWFGYGSEEPKAEVTFKNYVEGMKILKEALVGLDQWLNDNFGKNETKESEQFKKLDKAQKAVIRSAKLNIIDRMGNMSDDLVKIQKNLYSLKNHLGKNAAIDRALNIVNGLMPQYRSKLGLKKMRGKG